MVMEGYGMGELLDFRKRFDACLTDVGFPAARMMSLTAADGLTIDLAWENPPPSNDYLKAAVQALRLTAPTFEPAMVLLVDTERELAAGR